MLRRRACDWSLMLCGPCLEILNNCIFQFVKPHGAMEHMLGAWSRYDPAFCHLLPWDKVWAGHPPAAAQRPLPPFAAETWVWAQEEWDLVCLLHTKSWVVPMRICIAPWASSCLTILSSKKTKQNHKHHTFFRERPQKISFPVFKQEDSYFHFALVSTNYAAALQSM